MKATWKMMCTMLLLGIMIFSSSICIYAEEISPAGYHVYDVQENEASDTWYGISKGAYLHSGIAKLKQADDPGYAVAGGYTLAHMECDRVFIRIYLDQSANGTDGWGNVNYWTGEAFNTSYASASSGVYQVDRYQYYSVQGAHSVTEGDLTETTTTCTNAIYFN